MGFLKKITRPISRFLDKIVPNEIKPALPYLSAMAPFMLPGGIAGGQGLASILRRAALTGGLNIGSQLEYWNQSFQLIRIHFRLNLYPTSIESQSPPIQSRLKHCSLD